MYKLHCSLYMPYRGAKSEGEGEGGEEGREREGGGEEGREREGGGEEGREREGGGGGELR